MIEGLLIFILHYANFLIAFLVFFDSNNNPLIL
jgi:hypothetical protein